MEKVFEDVDVNKKAMVVHRIPMAARQSMAVAWESIKISGWAGLSGGDVKLSLKIKIQFCFKAFKQLSKHLVLKALKDSKTLKA